jgi:hypothetical protein
MTEEDRIRIGDLSPGDVALLKDVAEAAAERAVKKCFVAMGLDPSDPIKAQEDFGIMRYVGDKIRDPDFKEDLNFLRRTRVRSEGVIGKALATAIGLSVLGAAHAMWEGLKTLAAAMPR